MANIRSIGGNPIVLGMDGLDDEVKRNLTSSSGYSDLLTAGAADGIKGGGPTVDGTFLHRVTGGGQASDGPATIEVIRGNTLVWNQLVSNSATSVTVPSGHKYVARIDGTATLATSDGTAITVTGGTDNVFDLTQMFGAGNEPATVAEFEALYPEPYYEYDAGSLLSFNMEGIETVGFNQWDEEWEVGAFNTTTGENSTGPSIRAKNLIPIFPSTQYKINSPYGISVSAMFYDGSKSVIQNPQVTGGVAVNNNVVAVGGVVITTPANAHYMRFYVAASGYGATYKGDICINLSWSGRRNGEYEPFWSSQRLIDVTTYFPDGMRSAGTVYDELTSTEAITRVGVVDLGTLDYVRDEHPASSGQYRFACQSSLLPTSGPNGNLKCPIYEVVMNNGPVGNNSMDMAIYAYAGRVYIRNDAYATAAAFKAAMNGVMLYYELATPTVTPIDPALNLSYRAEQSGTETVLVPTGEMSAPVPMVIVYGSTPDGILDRSASLLAAMDGPTATANHAIGSYLTMSGQLYRVTTAIATGEAIVPGTNVTATTVMAEVLSLIQ